MSLRADEFLQTPDSQARKAATAYICLDSKLLAPIVCFAYRMCAIINRGLYIFYPIFDDHFFVFKEVFSQSSVLMYG